MKHGGFLITGTGRCGTKYVSQYLIAKGLDVQHEKVGKHGTSSWDLACGKKYFIKTDLPRFDKTIHIVRDPMKVINSFAITVPQWEGAWLFISQNSPVKRTDSQLLKAMKHWYHWNLMAEGIADVTIRIEDWSLKTIGDIFSLSGEEPDVPKDMNSRNSWNLMGVQYTVDDCFRENEALMEKIQKLALRYGYKKST